MEAVAVVVAVVAAAKAAAGHPHRCWDPGWQAGTAPLLQGHILID